MAKSIGTPKKLSNMASARTSGAEKRKTPGLFGVNEKNIDAIEQETISRVNKTLSALEIAIAAWDASDKPKEKQEKFSRYRWFHDALADWERKMLLAVSGKEEYETRLGRLQEFAVICHTYEGR